MSTVKNTIIGVVITLLCIGMVAVFSAGSSLGGGAGMVMAQRHSVWIILAMIALLAGSLLDYHWLLKHSRTLLIAAIVGLVCVLVGGASVNGAKRWLRIGPLSVQPSEFFKMVIVVYMAYFLSRGPQRIREFINGFMPAVIVMGIGFSLIVLQPDFGSAVLIAAVVAAMMYVAGVRLIHAFPMLLCALPILGYLVFAVPYRLRRFLIFLSPWSDPLGRGFHIIQSMIAFGSGGPVGAGPGAGLQKHFVPEAIGDFILAVIGEEWGFAGCMIIIALYLALIWAGFKVCARAVDKGGSLLALGVTLTLGLQALVNIGVVTSMLPTKGLPLPFISTGGSSMIALAFGIGTLLNVANHVQEQEAPAALGAKPLGAMPYGVQPGSAK